MAYRKKRKEFDERVIQISRVSKAHKGGTKLSFRSVVAVGDRKGKVGVGLGKAGEVASSIRKAVEKAKKNMIEVPLTKGTIPHEIDYSWKACRIILKPAGPGTGVIAGGVVKTILELIGVKNVLSKILGTSNSMNNAIAVQKALQKLRSPSEIYRLRGIKRGEKQDLADLDKEEKRKEENKKKKVKS